MAWTVEERRRYKREWNRRNRGRYHETEATWKKNNKQRLESARLKRQLRKLYGLTLADYSRMFTEQKGVCALCARPQAMFKKRFSIDHDHSTQRVRALLCGPCNTAIGLLQDDPDLMRRAAIYVESFQ